MKDGMKVIAYVLISSILAFLLTELGFKGARFVSVIGVLFATGAAISVIYSLFSELFGAFDQEGSKYVKAMLKIFGISLVFDMGADICSELGEARLAGSLLLVGRAEMLAVALPFVIEVLREGVKLI